MQRFYKIIIVSITCFFILQTVALGQFFLFGNSLVGEEAPDFKLKTLNSGIKTLSESREDKKAIMFFWATWCPHCRTALKNLSYSMGELENNDVKLILIDMGESEALIKNYMLKNNLELDTFLDTEGNLAITYNVLGLPTFYYVNAQGIIVDTGHVLVDNYLEVLSQSL